MTSVLERQQTNRNPLDKWSTRERLVLASAVANSGDQNWAMVSRNLKLICGANRPADWFSHNCCAVQYAELLENIDSNKKENKVVNSGGDSDAVVEASSDIMLRRLKEERIHELKAKIRKEQEEYAKAYAELKSAQSSQVTENQIIELWKDIEKEQEMQRIEEMKLENQLREREQRNLDMQRNWRTNVSNAATTSFLIQKQDEKSLDVSLEEIIGSNKPSTSGSQQQQATSPLLSSLLKSPTPGNSSSPIGTTAHATAPTITTLLTGGAIMQNQPAISLKSTMSASDAAQLLSRPISGPPTESYTAATSASQILLSPSQSAPTLSMLLEKNKIATSSNNTLNATTTENAFIEATAKEKKSLAVDSNNEEVPMDIEEDVAASSDLIDADDSEADANEEQQLLEVFKNIGNIDELEDIDVAAVIDEEVDFLKSVGDDPTDELDEEINFESTAKSQSGKQAKNFANENILELLTDDSESKVNDTHDEGVQEDSSTKNELKVETISSDDSNDNIPLATLGSCNSHDSKEQGLNSNSGSVIKDQNEENNADTLESKNHKEQELVNDAFQKSPSSVNTEVIVIPTDDDDSNSEKKQEISTANDDAASVGPCAVMNEENVSDPHGNRIDDTLETTFKRLSQTKEGLLETPEPPTAISLPDTDDESSETSDLNMSNIREEKLNAAASCANQELKIVENKFADDHTPVKPLVIRKLRDRDRSESPMTTVDDDTTASDHSITQRSRRRYSSTPRIDDSIPNSPASSDRDDRDGKTSKKSLLSIYSSLMASKNAAAFQRAQNECAAKFKNICNRNTDFQIIKKHIETNTIRSVTDLHRDILQLCQNAIMVFKTNSLYYKIVCDFMQDCESIKEFASIGPNNFLSTGTEIKDTKSSTSSAHASGLKIRGSSRKSLRIT